MLLRGRLPTELFLTQEKAHLSTTAQPACVLLREGIAAEFAEWEEQPDWCQCRQLTDCHHWQYDSPTVTVAKLSVSAAFAQYALANMNTLNQRIAGKPHNG